jgi:DNA primase
MSRLRSPYCLSGDTEVVTRDGIRPIASLADGKHELLVPTVTPYGLSTVGGFANVPILNLGAQHLFSIELRTSRRQKKTIHATLEHGWFVVTKRRYCTSVIEKSTAELRPGDVLKRLSATPMNRAEQVPFAVAQGFVFGDGCKGFGDRPATLTIYSKEKDGAMLRYFSEHRLRESKAGTTLIYGLPRTWKALPTIRESRSFLLSWLAGYFAADGCVSKIGAVRVDSANRSHIEFVRDLAAICGVEYGTIRKTMRLGTGTFETPLFAINLSAQHLPDWFFVNPRHLARIKDWRKKTVGHKQAWQVVSVVDSGKSQRVYCAQVEGAHAFGLADGIMTASCPAETPS